MPLVMNSRQFLASIRRLGRKRGLTVTLDKKRGKGSHALLYFGNRQTVLPNHKDDIGVGLLKSMCRDLDITRDALK